MYFGDVPLVDFMYFEDISLAEFMYFGDIYLWWSLWTLHLQATQVFVVVLVLRISSAS